MQQIIRMISRWGSIVGGTLGVFLGYGISVAHAAEDVASLPERIRTFPDLVSFSLNVINDIIVVILALGVMWVVYLAFVLIKAEGEKKDEARNSILYGLVGIFVMVSVWGLVNILVNTFNLDDSTRPVVPTLSV
ncbi:MAG: hypothetical protein AAB447_04050 [Patescibacteria group bacterium]